MKMKTTLVDITDQIKMENIDINKEIFRYSS